MNTEQYDIKTNIKIGQQIFDDLPNEIKPGWAGLVLSRFDNYIQEIPACISELYSYHPKNSSLPPFPYSHYKATSAIDFQ